MGGGGSSLSSMSLQVDVESGQEYFVLIDRWHAPPSSNPGVIQIKGTAKGPVFDDRFETLTDA